MQSLSHEPYFGDAKLDPITWHLLAFMRLQVPLHSLHGMLVTGSQCGALTSCLMLFHPAYVQLLCELACPRGCGSAQLMRHHV
jgi:hypothetical protein